MDMDIHLIQNGRGLHHSVSLHRKWSMRRRIASSRPTPILQIYSSCIPERGPDGPARWTSPYVIGIVVLRNPSASPACRSPSMLLRSSRRSVPSDGQVLPKIGVCCGGNTYLTACPANPEFVWLLTIPSCREYAAGCRVPCLNAPCCLYLLRSQFNRMQSQPRAVPPISTTVHAGGSRSSVGLQ